MYNKEEFRNENQNLIFEFIKAYPLALFIATTSKQLEMALLPVMQENNKLITHLSKSNPLVSILKENSGLTKLVFMGPQRYISPTIYQQSGNVPTWNYSLIEVTAKALLRPSPKDVENILTTSVDFFENRNQSHWEYKLHEKQKQPMLNALIGLELEIERIESKFKLNQNRHPEDQKAVQTFLSKSYDPRDQEMLYWMNRSSSKR